MSAPYNFRLDRTTRPGRLLLRAASSINNRGAGPLELVGRRRGATMRVYQAIDDRRGRRHLFRTRAQLFFKYVPGIRYGGSGVGSQSYWKLHLAAAFTLWKKTGHRSARLIRVGPKLDYCLRDLRRTSPSSRSPASAVYGGCSTDHSLRRDRLGTSVGWSDIYPYEYPQQWIDVTGLHGRFRYVQSADPFGLLHESNRRNNISETTVELPSGRVLARRTGLSRP